MAKDKDERELTDEQKAKRDREKMERAKLRAERLMEMQHIQLLLENAETAEEIGEATRKFEVQFGQG